MDTTDQSTDEMTVYVCYEYWSHGKLANNTPLLLGYSSRGFSKELKDFDKHPMRTEILALADLAGRDDDLSSAEDVGEDGRVRFSSDFKLPAEWFDGCEWE